MPPKQTARAATSVVRPAESCRVRPNALHDGLHILNGSQDIIALVSDRTSCMFEHAEK